MTPGPTEGKCANPAGGPGGMPLALPLSEGLGITRAATCAVLASLAYPHGSLYSEPCVLAGRFTFGSMI